MVTDRICVDGKRHNWILITLEYENKDQRRFTHCKKCGSITEFFNNRRCLDANDKNKYHIEIPDCHKE